ncbi:hypothetical protein FRZ61_19230 [Hypericibacter adhaerens]|jgi:hypothetical protein|uniref:Uncharacterized protein n=2 Tax=Hypericibacter adhaerens TaxID=2602016 RepID=A0A5J6MXS7_9PROT|nr:hypothetical protein FRZ61_19230 [Hypericibacter adhaerens]
MGVAGCALLIANAASADVNILANINKTKDITVTEWITISKTVNLTAVVDITPGKAAEATGIVNQTNYDNEACGNCAEKIDAIIDSIDGNTGLVNNNQSAGNMNNQGNAVSVAWDLDRPPGAPPPPPQVPAPGRSGFANSSADVDQKNGSFSPDESTTDIQAAAVLGDPNIVDTINLLFRDAIISGSINSNTGVVQVNQSVGNMNNQANQFVLAVSLLGDSQQGGVALSEADLGQVTTGNYAQESDNVPTSDDTTLVGINKNTTIENSISFNTGVIGVNQSAGNMSNQANNVSAAVVVVGSGSPPGAP